MTWFKVDDGFWSHPKTSSLSAEAIALWVRAGAYSCQHLTDGFIRTSALRMVGEADAADELVASELWVEVDGGWAFHDWDEYQETSDAVKKRRKDARERQRKAREARDAARANNDGDEQSDSQCESRVTSDVTETVTTSVSFSPPTRPDPTRPIQETSDPDGSDHVRPLPTYPKAFEEWWKLYPRKDAKRQALEAWRRARKRATDQQLAEGAQAYADDPNRDSQYTKQPSTWLNGDCWLSEPLPSKDSSTTRIPGSFLGEAKPGGLWTER